MVGGALLAADTERDNRHASTLADSNAVFIVLFLGAVYR